MAWSSKVGPSHGCVYVCVCVAYIQYVCERGGQEFVRVCCAYFLRFKRPFVRPLFPGWPENGSPHREIVTEMGKVWWVFRL